jgi:hypothetical protein
MCCGSRLSKGFFLAISNQLSALKMMKAEADIIIQHRKPLSKQLKQSFLRRGGLEFSDNFFLG